ncbi:MAG TPA: glycosyltransferase family 2 protein [Thermoanaerobaculia bacterium]
MDAPAPYERESPLASDVRRRIALRQTKCISVVVPVYYNEGSIPELIAVLTDVERQLEERGVSMELIFVDDGSGDDSWERLLEVKLARPATKLVRLTRNFGAIAASKTGFHFVTGDAFLILAADLQDPPDLLVAMVDRWLAGSKYVVAVREKRSDSVESRLFAGIYYRLLRTIAVRDYPEGGYDLALMSAELLPYLRASAKNINTPLYAYWLGFAPDVIRYTRQKRRHGYSRWTFWKRVKFFLDSLLGFSIVPIRFISACGLLVSIGSLAYALVIVVNAFRIGTEVPGFVTIVTLIAFLLGLVLLMLGVIGEYLWRVFDEVSGKPESVIDEIL